MALVQSFADNDDCAICHKNFTLPVKVLLCGHSFCGRCLVPLGGQGQIQCMQCGTVTFLTVHGVAGLTNNYALHRLLCAIRPPSRVAPPDCAFLIAPPSLPVALNVPTDTSWDVSSGRSLTPDSSAQLVPSILVSPAVSPIQSSPSVSPVLTEQTSLADHSTVWIQTPSAVVVVGPQSRVVTSADCVVNVGAYCRIFSENPNMPEPPKGVEKVEGRRVKVGGQSAVYVSSHSQVTVSDSSDIWLGDRSVLAKVGPHCVWHTAVKGVYKPAI